MRTIRRLGLLLAAAVCVSAFAAASASASGVACTSAADADPGTPAIECPTADLYGEDVLGAGNAPLDVTLASANAVFTTSSPSGSIQCNESSGGGEITESGDNVTTGPAGYLSNLSFSQNGSQNCPMTITGLPPLTAATTAVDNNGANPGLWDVGGAWLSDNSSGSPNGTLTLGNVKVDIALSLGFTCTYEAASVAGDLYNTGNGEQLVFEDEVLQLSNGGLLCPSSGEFTATYALTAPSDLYIRSDDA